MTFCFFFLTSYFGPCCLSEETLAASGCFDASFVRPLRKVQQTKCKQQNSALCFFTLEIGNRGGSPCKVQIGM